MRSGDPVTITDWKMTRFMMTTSEAVELVFRAFRQGLPGEVLTMKSPACTVRDLYLAVCGHYKPVRIIGVRDGERMHEYLTERYSSDKARRLTIDELKEML
jgi:UDP-glucose 4-epimerase